jgi:hypothetical protein
MSDLLSYDTRHVLSILPWTEFKGMKIGQVEAHGFLKVESIACNTLMRLGYCRLNLFLHSKLFL